MDVTTVQTSGDRPLAVEFWDFPGSPDDEDDTARRLRSAFFHAAVICYSVEDPAGLAAVEKVVRIPVVVHAVVVFAVADR